MKRLFLLLGLLLVLATPNFAQTKTDTIRFDIKPIEGYDPVFKFVFPDSIRSHIEIEWVADNEMNSHWYKPGENRFNPDEDGFYICSIRDSGQIRIYYTYKEHSSYGFCIGPFYAIGDLVISVWYNPDDIREISLDISNCSALTWLDCHNNQLTSLDVSNNTALTSLDCHDNQLTSLDVSHNTALTELSCYDNQLTNLDVSYNLRLTSLACGNNQLTSLDVSNNTSLTSLGCDNNQLTSLDLSLNSALTYLYCDNTPLISLDLSLNTALTELYCSNIGLSSLDVSHNTALSSLACWGNQLTSLDVSNNTSLTLLYCANNQLSNLDLSYNTALFFVNCNNNQLTSLDISYNTSLTTLYCGDNQLRNLNLGNKTLADLTCNGNRIPLSMLYNIYSQQERWSTFNTSDQTDTIFIRNQQSLDLSSERILGKNVSTFKLSDADGATLSSDVWTEKDFSFHFHQNGLYELTIQNNFDNESEEPATFTWYVSVVDEMPEGYFTVLAKSDNAEWGTVTGNGTYQEGKEAIITATPADGYRFVNWTKQDGSVFSTEAVHTFKVTENLELTAYFEKLPDDVANESLQENDNLRVYVQDRTIYLSENRGVVQVYNMAGQCVYNGTATAIPVRQSGVYIVRVGARSHKVLVR